MKAEQSAMPYGHLTEDDVVVVGLSCRCAGAEDASSLWQIIRDGQETVRPVHDTRSVETFSAGAEEAGQLSYGTMADVDLFDPLFFHISPREAEQLDVTQRLLLQECYRALEDAGIAPGSLKKAAVGTYMGVTGERGPAGGELTHLSMLGSDVSILAARMAYFLDLKGPALAINTACSSSLVALDLAYKALKSQDIDLALAGGISIAGQVGTYASMSNAGMLSPTGHCRPFDQRADGIVVGDGVGVVVLKRLGDARRDGNPIYAAIRGSGTNQDGQTSGITVPSFHAQSELQATVYRRARIEVEALQYVEAHGTGTRLGDPIEVHALTRSIGQFTPRTGFVALGSLKANIGHTAAAAGVMGAIKVLLCLEHAELPPSPHFQTPNPHIDFSRSPVYVNTRRRHWPLNTQGRRLAALSSFGYSGTNAHMVFEAAPSQPARSAHPGPFVVLLSSRHAAGLRAQAEKLLQVVETQPELALDALAYTLQVGRDAHAQRLGLVVSSREQLIEGLSAFLSDRAQEGLFKSPPPASAQSQRDEDLPTLLDSWFSQRRLTRLVEVWVQGHALDWRRLYGDSTPQCLHLPTYVFARDRYTPAPLEGNPVPSKPVAAPLPATHAAEATNGASALPGSIPPWDGFSFFARWEAAPLPAEVLNDGHASSPQTGCSLFVYSEGPSVSFVEALTKRWPNPVQVQLSSQTQQQSPQHWQLDAQDPSAIEELLSRLGPIDSVIYLAPGLTHAPSPAQTISHAAAEATCEETLLRFMQALTSRMDEHAANDQKAGLDLYILLRDIPHVDVAAADQANGDARGAGLCGLASSIAQSDRRVRVRCLALPAKSLHAALVEAVRHEPPSERGELFALRHGQRYQRVFRKFQWGGVEQATGFRTGGTYLIVGGSGVVGSLLTQFLLEKYQANVIWLGRRPSDHPQVEVQRQHASRRGRIPAYVQADVTQPQALTRALERIGREHPALNGVIFAAVEPFASASASQTQLGDFAREVHVKSRGTWALLEALSQRPAQGHGLDFVLFCSSVQGFSFLSSKETPGYATGITLSDGLVQTWQTNTVGIHKPKLPLGIVHWGYFEASVAGSPLEARVRQHFTLIDAPTACQFLERFTAALRQGLVTDALCLGTQESARVLMGCPENSLLSLPAKSLPMLLPKLASRPDADDQGWRSITEGADWRGFEDWLGRLMFVQLRALGLLPMNSTQAGSESAEKLFVRMQLHPRYQRWWHTCGLEALIKQGYLEAVGAGLVPTARATQQPSADVTWQQWTEFRPTLMANPEARAAVSLVEGCLKHLPEILRGTLPPTEVLFPESSMETVGEVYQRNALSDFFNLQVAEAVRDYVQLRREREPNARVRILEVGAGTGGTTATVLPLLQPLSAALETYVYSDVSRAFLLHAQEHFKPLCPVLEGRLWNVEQPPTTPGIPPHSFDVVIATNVLHATRNIRKTLQNVRAAMLPGGLLVLNEGTQKTLLGSLTFGLLDGWWLFEDEALRISGAPLLTAQGWQRALEAEGFESHRVNAEAAEALGQQVLLAQAPVLQMVELTQSLTPMQADVEAEVEAAAMLNATAAPTPFLESASAVSPQPEARPTLQGRPDPTRRVRGALLESLTQTLKLPPHEVDVQRAFSDYGIDSILGVSFVKGVGQRLGITLNTTVLFDHTNVEALTRHVVTRFRDKLEQSEPVLPEPRKTEPQKPEPRKPEPRKPEAQKPAPVQLSVAQFEADVGADARPVAEPTGAFAPASASAPATPTRTHGAPRSGLIAVIGISGQFPNASNVQQFWKNLVAGKDAVESLVLPDLAPQDKAYRWGGILEHGDCFDPLFFHIAPREAELMNKHQRLVLQESWKCLEDAGYNPRSFAGQKVGIFVGAEPSGQLNHSLTGSSDAIIASRLSYVLDLKGPALVVNTGCSSSGVALHLACESLRRGESRLALAGGAYAVLDPKGLSALADIEMLSPTGECHTFDASANGTVLSEAVAMVALKPLDAALADGDAIYGVIEASGVNQDGASNGITAPNGAAQEALMCDLYTEFGIDPATISAFEVHGTGTKLGDPVEANAMVRAFHHFRSHRLPTSPQSPQTRCVVGSAKSHIGHCSAAAAVVGLIKLLMSMQHKSLPGMLHFKTLNPLIELEDSPFVVEPGLTSWERPEPTIPRRAALSSFGHSGTNVHLVVREPLDTERIQPPPTGQATNGLAHAQTTPGATLTEPVAILLSAKDDERLRAYVEALRDYLCAETPPLALLASTLQTGREALEVRVGWCVTSQAMLLSRLEAFLASPPRSTRRGFELPDGAFGHARSFKEAYEPFADDEDIALAIHTWIEKGRLEKLVSLWVRGFPVPWDRLANPLMPANDRAGGHVPNRQVRRVHAPTYPFARTRYQLETTATRPQSAPVSMDTPSPTLEVSGPRAGATAATLTPDAELLAHVSRWEEVDGPTAGNASPHAAPKKVWLVGAPAQANWLDAFEQASLAAGAAEVQRLSPDDWRSSDPSAGSAARASTPDRVIWVGAEGQEADLLQFYRTLHARLLPTDTLDLFIVTVEAQQVAGDASTPSAVGLSGLGYAIAQTDHRIRVRNLDLAAGDGAPELTAQAALALLEPASSRGEIFALRDGIRYRQGFYPLDWTAVSTGSALRRGGTYLLVGGSGAVGELVTHHLLTRYQATVIWLGRQPETQVAHKLARLRVHGPLHYYAVDVTDLSALQATVTRIGQSHGALNGAFFSAMHFEPHESLLELPMMDFQQRLAVKIQGSRNLYKVLKRLSLDFLTYFSSIQAFSFLSARESLSYAAGIVGADAWVRGIRQEAPFPIGLIHWGYWQRSVEGSPLAEKVAAHFGLISDTVGLELLERALSLLTCEQLDSLVVMAPTPGARALMAGSAQERVVLLP